jgi:hypothetical protein
MRMMFALFVGIVLAGVAAREGHGKSAPPPESKKNPSPSGLVVDYVGLDGVQARYVGRGRTLVLEALRDRSAILDAEGAILTDLRLPPRRAGDAALEFAIDEAVKRTRARLERMKPSDRTAVGDLLRLYTEATQALIAELNAEGKDNPELWGFDLHPRILLRAARAASLPVRD